MESGKNIFQEAEAKSVFSSAYRLAYLQTWSAPGAAIAAKRAMLCFAAKKSAGTTQEQQACLFRLTLSCGREQRLRARFGGGDPLSREPAFSVPEAERAFAAVGKLSATNRIILYLYYKEDYSMAEIAALLRRREGAVGRALQKAQDALRAELGEQDWKTLLPAAFAAIVPEENVWEETKAALARGAKGRGPAVKYAAAGTLALLIVLAFVAAPLLESRPAQGAVSSAAASGYESVKNLGEKVSFELVSFDNRESDGKLKEVPVTQEVALTATAEKDNKNEYRVIFDFPLQYDGPNLEVERVTYTAYQCKLMKKVSYSVSEFIHGDSAEETNGVTFQANVDGTLNHYYGYTSLGFVYSAYPDDAKKLRNLAVCIFDETEDHYISTDKVKFQDDPQKVNEMKKAIDRAYIEVEVKPKAGATLHRKIRFASRRDLRTVTARLTEE